MCVHRLPPAPAHAADVKHDEEYARTFMHAFEKAGVDLFIQMVHVRRVTGRAGTLCGGGMREVRS